MWNEKTCGLRIAEIILIMEKNEQRMISIICMIRYNSDDKSERQREETT